ncbi:617_t:CDS:2, partial [Acaulospora morrowiae]
MRLQAVFFITLLFTTFVVSVHHEKKVDSIQCTYQKNPLKSEVCWVQSNTWNIEGYKHLCILEIRTINGKLIKKK